MQEQAYMNAIKREGLTKKVTVQKEIRRCIDIQRKPV